MIRAIISVFLALASSLSFANFVSVAAPAGYSVASGVSMYKAAANDSVFSGGIRSASSAVLNTGGKQIAMGVAYRYAANAPLFAARAILSNPLILAVSGASIALDWYKARNIEIRDGVPQIYVQGAEVNFTSAKTGWMPYQPGVVVGNGVNGINGTQITKYRFSDLRYLGYPNFYYVVSLNWCVGQCGDGVFNGGANLSEGGGGLRFAASAWRPATESDFPTTITSEVAKSLAVPLPVELPILNPSADAIPISTTKTVVLGLPQPIPGTSPLQYKTPAVDIVPAPTADDPFRVDLQPKDIVRSDAVSPTTGTETGSTKTPSDDAPGQCDLYPDSLACQTLDVDTAPDLDTKIVELSVSPVAGFAGGGSCPAPRHLNVGQGYQLSYQGFCDFASMVKPVILTFAWLGAAAILIGARGGD